LQGSIQIAWPPVACNTASSTVLESTQPVVVGINVRDILAACRQKRERQAEGTRLAVVDRANEPGVVLAPGASPSTD
jgi:glutamate racemase